MSVRDERAATEIDAVVFDLGGVLLDWDPRHLYRKLFDDEAEMEVFLREHDGGHPGLADLAALEWALAEPGPHLIDAVVPSLLG